MSVDKSPPLSYYVGSTNAIGECVRIMVRMRLSEQWRSLRGSVRVAIRMTSHD